MRAAPQPLAAASHMLSTSTRLAPLQQQAATPRLLLAVRLLQMSSLEFAQELAAMSAVNPFLDVDDADADAADGDHQADATDVARPSAGSDRALSAGNDDLDALDLLPARPGLRALLTAQLRLMRLSPRDHALARLVIESLEDDGYLRSPLGQLAIDSGLSPEPDACEMNTALLNVQALEPAGIGARDLAECLGLQLRALAADHTADNDAADVALAIEIARHHLPRLARHDLAGIGAGLGRAPGQIAAAVRLIRRLDPRPGLRHAPPEPAHITPDVIVRKRRGAWQVALHRDSAPRVRVNTRYAEMFERHREAADTELAHHLQEARWTVRHVAQRRLTITAVAQAIVARQTGFFEFGAPAMRPLGLREIAQAVGVHESTVCRATQGKYMATPAGVFELRHFFSRALPTDSGAACSATAIRGVIAQMIAGENAGRPLSDGDIARQLNRQGLPVARRTVTKYRQGLKLPVAQNRVASYGGATVPPTFA